MNLKELTILLADWSDYVVFALAILSLLTFKKNSFFKILTIYCFSLSAVLLLSTVLAIQEFNNLFLYHIIGLIEMVFAFLLYRKLGLEPVWNYILVFFITLYLVDSVIVFSSGGEEMNNLGMALCMLFVLLLGVNYIWKLYSEEKVVQISRHPLFYISAGFIFYAAGSFFGYLMITKLFVKEVPVNNFLISWIIISGFVYVKFVLIGIGILFARNEQ